MSVETMLIEKYEQHKISLASFVDSTCEVSEYYDNSLVGYYEEEEETYEEFINRLESERV